MSDALIHTPQSWPEPRAMLTLIKPITWFPPVWAYLCGAVSSGVPLGANWTTVLPGMVLAGPIVCGMSQAANDWCDRHVDAVNEPHRPIPSGRIPGRWGLWIALAMTVLSLAVGWLLGPWGFGATVVGVIAAWAYSAEPVRLKRSGWWGPGLVGLSDEGLPWFTGAAVLLGAAPRVENLMIAGLYAFGAPGVMTLDNCKSLDVPVHHGRHIVEWCGTQLRGVATERSRSCLRARQQGIASGCRLLSRQAASSRGEPPDARYSAWRGNVA